MKATLTLLAVLCILACIQTGCRKESLLTRGGSLEFSVDTLTFDTVFTARGSFTLGITIRNTQNQKVKVSSIRLGKGDLSAFRLNVDGIAGNQLQDREIAANDSLHVFATVFIDPTSADNPFVVEDRLIATLNGAEHSIPVIAYGQNAYYINGELLGSGTLKTDKPYVVINSAGVNENETLIIPPGCRIYMHANSRFFVMGRLIARGTKTDSIIFQGDRLDRDYFGDMGLPGEWGGIYFFETSQGNELDWVVLKNCGNSAFGAMPAAIQVTGNSTAVTNRQLTMNHTVIETSQGYGLLAFQANILVENSLVYATGGPAAGIFQGGLYTIRNSSFINYFPPSTINHTDQPTVSVLNYLDTGDREHEYIAAPLKADFINCLIYGSLDEELVVRKKGTQDYDVHFDHCLIKTSRDPQIVITETVFSSCKFNEDPRFMNHREADYRAADASSPMVNAGTGTTMLSATDLDDRPRNSGPIDIGCYEFQ